MTPLTVGQLRRAIAELPDEQTVFVDVGMTAADKIDHSMINGRYSCPVFGLEPSWGQGEPVLLLEL